MSKRRIIVSVINDLVSDQRVKRTCSLLYEMGFTVTLVGRVLPHSPPADERPYRMHRMKLWFRRGPLFYLEYQFRLWFFLLRNQSEFLLANDLDTLLPNYLHSGKNRKLIYDTHEYFTAVPELQNAPFKRKIWETLEAWIFPKLEHIITVNESIARVYQDFYGKKLRVVRNVPAGFSRSDFPDRKSLRQELKLPIEAPLMILQGSGINIDRGAEEALESLIHLKDWHLLVIGSGDVFPLLPGLAEKFGVSDRLIIRPRVPWQDLMKHTMAADLGLSLDKDTNLNYRYSLPNKLFDYIQCGTPVIGSALPEIKSILLRYKVGTLVEIVDARSISLAALRLYPGSDAYITCESACLKAAPELCWEREKEGLRELFETL
jgi:glycosyltransferase involved in cell wall biosynthesis